MPEEAAHHKIWMYCQNTSKSRVNQHTATLDPWKCNRTSVVLHDHFETCPERLWDAVECGGGGVSGDLVPIHAACRVPRGEDLHPDDLQWAEGAAQGCDRESLCGTSGLWPSPQGTASPPSHCCCSHLFTVRFCRLSACTLLVVGSCFDSHSASVERAVVQVQAALADSNDCASAVTCLHAIIPSI